jgi:hypothetical protein
MEGLTMCTELELVREEKLHELLRKKDKDSELEASGVYVMDKSTCYVIFDNLNKVAVINLSLKPHDSNRIISVLNVGTGFEDITYDPRKERFYLIIEARKVKKGEFRGLVSEYKRDFTFCSCTQLDVAFPNKNKGFEGVGHIWRGDTEYLVGLWEDTLEHDDDSKGKGTGLLHLFRKTTDGMWARKLDVELPSTAQFEDYAAIAQRGDRVAVISQASRRLWVGEVNETADGFATETGKVYRFPSKRYGNVEGVSWYSDDELVMVSDQRKKRQDERDADKDQSIHIFRIPAG